MSEEPGSEEVAFDSAAFEEWVEKTAQSKDIPRGEVLDQMLSSYWIFEELTGMIGGGDQASAISSLGQSTAGSEAESVSSGDTGSKTDVETSGEDAERTDEKNTSELISEFQQLRSAIVELSERPETAYQQPEVPEAGDGRVPPSSTPRRTDDKLRRTLSDLQDRVESLSDELSKVQDKHDHDVTELRTDIEETLETLEMLESSVEGLVDTEELESLAVSLEEELSRIDNTTAELNGRLAQLEEVHSETASVASDLADGQSELEARLTQAEDARAETASAVNDLADGQSELEARLDREFDSIENLFQHLLDTTNELEHRLEAVSTDRKEEIEPLKEDLAEREQLITIMKKANRKGISTAVCDSCKTTANLEMLHEPYCPECDRSITGVEPDGWSPFDKPTLKTEPIQSVSEGLDDDAPDPSDLIESAPDDTSI
jgi:hypothetical protein